MIWDDFEIYRTVYADRVLQSVQFREHRAVDPYDFLSVTLRKAF